MEISENEKFDFSNIIKPGSIIQIAGRVLMNINKEIAFHNERTAWLALKIAQAHPMSKKCSLQDLVLLAYLHTIGFFREEPFFNYNPHDFNTDFFTETKAVESKYVFGCYYLEFMTPLHKSALALENFTRPYNGDIRHFVFQEEYKAIIYLAARISDWFRKCQQEDRDLDLPKDLNDLAPGYFDPDYLQVFEKLNEDNAIIHSLENESFRDDLYAYISKTKLQSQDVTMLLKLLIYLLDFKSTVTVKHSINTSCYALSLGKRMELSDEDLKKLFVSAMLHDIGKIATPQRILEFPGRLTPEDMGIMRHHVNHSKRILSTLVPDEILENIYAHHEKLNGAGYPRKLTAQQISLIQRILTVADITSALCDSRSYKEEYSNSKTISIIKEMTENGDLDPTITKFVFSDLESLQAEQATYQPLLSTDFSKVVNKYNDFIFDDTTFDEIPDSATPAGLEEIAELEEI